MFGAFPSGHRINPEGFLERPWQNSPAKRTMYGAPQNIQKPLGHRQSMCVTGNAFPFVKKAR